MTIAVKCPDCGSAVTVPQGVPSPNTRCASCGKRIDLEPAELGGSSQQNPIHATADLRAESSTSKIKVCAYCGEEVLGIARKCKHCGEFFEERPKEWNGPAAVLSYFQPGLGQLYKGWLVLGVAWSLLVLGLYAMSLALLKIGPDPSANAMAALFFGLIAFLFHFLCVLDAGRSTSKPSRLPYLVLPAFLFVGVLLASTIFKGSF